MKSCKWLTWMTEISSSIPASVEDVFHNSFQFFINFLASPVNATRVLRHFQPGNRDSASVRRLDKQKGSITPSKRVQESNQGCFYRVRDHRNMQVRIKLPEMISRWPHAALILTSTGHLFRGRYLPREDCYGGYRPPRNSAPSSSPAFFILTSHFIQSPIDAMEFSNLYFSHCKTESN